MAKVKIWVSMKSGYEYPHPRAKVRVPGVPTEMEVEEWQARQLRADCAFVNVSDSKPEDKPAAKPAKKAPPAPAAAAPKPKPASKKVEGKGRTRSKFAFGKGSRD
jgi:hypothetical protein